VFVTPRKFNGGVAGSAIAIVNALLTLVPALSRTATVALDVPGAVGVPIWRPRRTWSSRRADQWRSTQAESLRR